MIFNRTQAVPMLSEYEDYRPYLCRDFDYRCAYCLRHEFFFGGGEAGEIDHHRPRHLFPALTAEYSNLYWSCRKCNAVKGGKWPSAEQMENGIRFLDPCVEDHDDHWTVQADGTLEPLTLVGRYTIQQIRLDGPTLIEFRALMYRLEERTQEIEAALAGTGLSLEVRASLQAEVAATDLLLRPPVFAL